MASSASLIVTPFRFLATTSSPRGKCRSIFLIGGSVSSFLRMSLSSIVDVDVLTFLCHNAVRHSNKGQKGRAPGLGLPSCLLCLWSYLELDALLLCWDAIVSAVVISRHQANAGQKDGAYRGPSHCTRQVRQPSSAYGSYYPLVTGRRRLNRPWRVVPTCLYWNGCGLRLSDGLFVGDRVIVCGCDTAGLHVSQ